MPIITRIGGGGGDKSSTLPPPVSNLKAQYGNMLIDVSFDLLGSEYSEYLSDKDAYIIVLKEGSVPQSMTDGTVVKMDKNGTVI